MKMFRSMLLRNKRSQRLLIIIFSIFLVIALGRLSLVAIQLGCDNDPALGKISTKINQL